MDLVTTQQASRFRTFVDAASRIVVIAHMNPDGDAVGSTTAMWSFLTSVVGKEASVVLPDAPAPTLDFIAGRYDIVSEASEARSLIASSDLLVCLDFNVPSRLGALEDAFRSSSASKLLVDHHLNPDRSAFDLVISTPSVSSASELLFHLLLRMPEVEGDACRLPSDCALSLMTGMTTDTNNFANSVFPSTLRMASSLLEAGVDRDWIVSCIFNNGREEKLRAWSWILSNRLTIMPCGLAYMLLSAEEKSSLKLMEGELEGLVNQPLQIGKVKVSVFLREEDGYFHMSLRSKKGVAVNGLASQFFHGGGHAQASGGRIYFPEDIPSPDCVREYFENIAARFMQNELPSDNGK